MYINKNYFESELKIKKYTNSISKFINTDKSVGQYLNFVR